ncbi:MAG: glycosyltransferase family 39 protein [Planctomycetota bacterium]
MRSKVGWGAAVGLGIVALALRVLHISESLWLDELFVTDLKLGSWAGIATTLYSDAHPPLYFVVMYCWNAVFGDGPVSVRVLPLISGLLSIPLGANVARKFGGLRAAWMTACFMTFSVVLIEYSREARPYAFNLLLTLVFFRAWCGLVETPERSSWRWLSLFSGTALVLTHYYGAVFLLLAFVWAGGAPGSKVRRKLLGAGLVAFLAIGSWVVLLFGLAKFETSRAHLATLDLAGVMSFFGNWIWCGDLLDPALGAWAEVWRQAALPYVQGFGLALFAVSGLIFLIRDENSAKRPHLLVLPTAALAIPALAWLAGGLAEGKNWVPRSALPSAYFFFASIAVVLARLPRRLGIALAVLIVVFQLALCVLLEVEGSRWRNRDWEGAAQILVEHQARETGASLLMVGDPLARPLSYYQPVINQTSDLAYEREQFEKVKRGLTKVFGDESTLRFKLERLVQEQFDIRVREAEALSRRVKLRFTWWQGHSAKAFLAAHPEYESGHYYLVVRGEERTSAELRMAQESSDWTIEWQKQVSGLAIYRLARKF